MSHLSNVAVSRSPQNWQPRSQKVITLILVAVLLGAAIALSSFGWRQSVLFLIGSLFGLSLYHAAFGFAAAYRKLVVYGDVQGVMAQIVMLALATVLFAPVLIQGNVFGRDVTASVSPVAVQGAIGAFLFGIGMQLGSGCACGTLYTIGGGSSLMLLTLLTFGIGSFWASLTGEIWAGLPRTAPLSLIQLWGWRGLALQLLVLLSIASCLWLWSQHRKSVAKKSSIPILAHARNTMADANHEPRSLFSGSLAVRLQTLIYGPWSVLAGAIALAVLNWLTLLIAGRPWGVTWGFTLWTAKIAQWLGWNPASSEFWSQGVGAKALSQSVFADVISVMNFGIIVGAALAAALAGRLAFKPPASKLAVSAALIGGVMMGYGARLAFGCNVGAYFSGIASTSLHGWLWIAFALLGTFLGVRLRLLFRLSI